MRTAERYINRDPKLAAQLVNIMADRGLSIPQVVEETGVSHTSVNMILHPYRWSGRGVSKKCCVDVIEALTPYDLQKRIELCSLAEIDVVSFKGSRTLFVIV